MFLFQTRIAQRFFNPAAAKDGCVRLNGIRTQVYGRGKENNGSQAKSRTTET